MSYLESAEATLAHYQMQPISEETLCQVEDDIQETCMEFAEYGLRLDEDACDALAMLYRIRRNLEVALESDRKRAFAKQIADDEINFDALSRRLS